MVEHEGKRRLSLAMLRQPLCGGTCEQHGSFHHEDDVPLIRGRRAFKILTAIGGACRKREVLASRPRNSAKTRSSEYGAEELFSRVSLGRGKTNSFFDHLPEVVGYVRAAFVASRPVEESKTDIL